MLTCEGKHAPMSIYIPFLTRKRHRILGLDITSMAVKILELSGQNGRYKVEHYGVATFPRHTIIDNDIKDLAVVAEAIKLAHARSLATTLYVAVAVPDSVTITKTLVMDASLSEEEMYEHVQLEAARHIPYPLDEVSLDFNILGLNEKDNNKVDVLIVAARNEHVYSRVEAITQAGLIPKIVDVESFSMQRICELMTPQLIDQGKKKTIAVIDIGSTFTTIVILHDLTMIYHHDQILGSYQLTEAIQEHYSVSYEEAEKMKQEAGIADDYLPEILTPFREAFIPLIRRSFQLFFSTNSYSEIDQILLVGGGARTMGLAELIEERLSTPCVIGNPFLEMALGSQVNAAVMTADAPKLMIATGLALRMFSQ